MADAQRDAGSEHEDDEELVVPEGVLRGIEDIAAGNTASKDDLESVLKD